jgi:hypothetical protein
MRRNLLGRLIAAANASGVNVVAAQDEAMHIFKQKEEPKFQPFWREPKQKASYPKAPKTLRK